MRDGYSGQEAAAFLHKLLDRVKTLPSVTSASLTETIPVAVGNTALRFSEPTSSAQDSPVLHDASKYLVGKETISIRPASQSCKAEDFVQRMKQIVHQW